MVHDMIVYRETSPSCDYAGFILFLDVSIASKPTSDGALLSSLKSYHRYCKVQVGSKLSTSKLYAHQMIPLMLNITSLA